jgi:ATP-dependent DNA helicase DinG
MATILNSFPKQYTPYEHQIDVISQLNDAIKNKIKFIILQAPTGSGKSMFAATLANASNLPSENYINLVDDQKILLRNSYGQYLYADEILNSDRFGSFTLTVSKQLQDQYQKLFEDTSAVFKGRTNYICEVDDEFTCEMAPCLLSSELLKTCINEKRCPYINERARMLKNKFSILNYSTFLCLPDHLKRRQFLICDEASELEDEIIKRYSIDINYHMLLKRFDIQVKKLLTDDRHKAHYWLSDLIQSVNNGIKTIELKIGRSKKTYMKKQLGDLIKLKNLVNFRDSIELVLENWNEAEYIVEQTGDSVSFSPLYVNKISKHIFDHADHIILMSATIIDPKTFARILGICNYKYIEAPSVFKPEKSPIFCPGKYPLNYANIAINLPKVAKQTVELCEEHNNEKGIIHTHNFKITEAIQRKTRNNKRFLFREAGVSNEVILKEHFANESNSVIVSPSLGFGTDLIGSHGEFQIIVKLPYLPLGSKRIKLLAKKDPDWYIMKMLINLIQMSGRCTRSKDDSSKTYILDGQAVNTLKRNWNKLSKSFKDRLK